MSVIHGMNFDEERALYHLQNTSVDHCNFAGEADGESALKESHGITISDCTFELRYPLWHADRFSLDRCTMTETCRAAVWYAKNGRFSDCTLSGIKMLRECSKMELQRCTVTSPEFGWKCRNVSLDGVTLAGEYVFLESKNLDLSRFTLSGKYSFQYTENVTITNSDLDTKDAFWHSRNVTVKNSTIKGEYLGWYSRGLTLINCTIIGTQPLCYCRDLTLIDCRMIETDLAFEYSDVKADLQGEVLSVKNPKSGKIIADGYGSVIRENAVYPVKCKIITQK